MVCGVCEFAIVVGKLKLPKCNFEISSDKQLLFQGMSRKRRVTLNQLEALWEILNENRALATGYNKSTQAREYSKRMWQTAADTLNSQGDGAEKDWKGWSKYWNDYKSKLKGKVASTRASLHRTGGGPSHEGRLSEIDLKFLQLLGEDFGSGLPGIRVEPNFDNPSEDWTEAGSAPLSAHSEQSQSILAHHNMESVDLRVITPEPIAGASTPPAPALASIPPPPSQPPLAATAAPPPPRVSSTPRRRQRHRRVVPMSADTARRALVNMSEERVRLDEQRIRLDARRNQILESLTLKLEEIRNILTRQAPSTQDN